MTTLPFDADFFARNWRKEPLVLDATRTSLVDAAPTAAEFVRYAEAADELGVRVRTDGKTVWFLEGVVDEIPFAADLVRQARKTFEWEDIWCDLFRTSGPSSIGCHFDNSDNFSMQLSGTKQWRLSPPSTIPVDDLRRRLLNEPGVGAARLGDEVRTFTVGPGQVLYIPALWVHWGQSESDSTSISLVVNCHTAFDTLRDAVVDTLRRDPAWWRALPVGPGTEARRRSEVRAAVTATFLPPARHDIHIREITAMTRTATREPAPFRLDVDRVRRFVASAPEPPTSELLLPSGGTSNSRLRGLLARRTLRRLLKVIAVRVEQAANPADRVLYQVVADTVLGLSDDQLDVLCTEPEITSWVAVAEAAPQPQAPRSDDALAAQLAAVLLPELAAAGASSIAVAVDSDVDGAFTLRRVGLRLVPTAPVARAHLTVADGVISVVGPAGPTTLRVDAQPPGFTVEALPTLLDDGPRLLPAPPAWMAAHIPGDMTAVDRAGAAEFGAAMSSGAAVLREHWPQAWQELTESVRILLPLQSRGHEPYNYSVHGFRGLILSSPRYSYLAAQTLAHETAHNKMSTLVDLFPICRNSDETVVSPVVGAERPLINVFHGAYAFSQELALTRRLIGAVPDLPGLSMTRYLQRTTDKVASALAVLERVADPEPVGAALMREVRAVLDDGV